MPPRETLSEVAKAALSLLVNKRERDGQPSGFRGASPRRPAALFGAVFSSTWQAAAGSRSAAGSAGSKQLAAMLTQSRAGAAWQQRLQCWLTAAGPPSPWAAACPAGPERAPAPLLWERPFPAAAPAGAAPPAARWARRPLACRAPAAVAPQYGPRRPPPALRTQGEVKRGRAAARAIHAAGQGQQQAERYTIGRSRL